MSKQPKLVGILLRLSSCVNDARTMCLPIIQAACTAQAPWGVCSCLYTYIFEFCVVGTDKVSCRWEQEMYLHLVSFVRVQGRFKIRKTAEFESRKVRAAPLISYRSSVNCSNVRRSVTFQRATEVETGLMDITVLILTAR